MNQINFFNNESEIIKQNYFILPYYSQQSIVYIKLTKNNIQWFNSSLKTITPFKRINKSLKYFYQISKFNGYSIILIGYLNKYNNFRSLAVFDLMLQSQFLGLSISKKYSTRRQNLNLRFFITIPDKIKNVYAAFSKKYSNELFHSMCQQCILSNKWEGYSLYNDKPYNYDEYSMISKKLWSNSMGKIAKVEVDQKTNKVISLIVEDDETHKLCNILYGLESLKNDNILNMNCTFKKCFINSKSNFIFLNLN